MSAPKLPPEAAFAIRACDAYRAARDLREAADFVLARWERGDLAEAVRGLASAVEAAKAAGL